MLNSMFTVTLFLWCKSEGVLSFPTLIINSIMTFIHDKSAVKKK